MPKYESPSTDDRRIWDLFLSGTNQGAMVAADDAGIFNALNEAPASIEELAGKLDFDVRATGVLLRLLAGLGLFSVRGDRYQLTDQARLYLVKSSPFYWGNMARVGVNAYVRDTLLTRLKEKGSAERAGPEDTPKPTGEGGRPADGWAAGNISIEQAHTIAAGMHSHSLGAAIGAARNYDCSGVKKILDVGGGSGCFMIAFAQANPSLKCTIMELGTMCEVAGTYIKNGEVEGQVDTLTVDMFREPWPKGYDAVFFSNVWHDWNFRTCKWLAEKTFEILPSGGRIMLHEMLLEDGGTGPVTPAGFSMLMLLGTQGQQFTFLELKEILESVGFTGIEAQHTSGYYSITTGYKP
jgi:hypothetical protein